MGSDLANDLANDLAAGPRRTPLARSSVFCIVAGKAYFSTSQTTSQMGHLATDPLRSPDQDFYDLAPRTPYGGGLVLRGTSHPHQKGRRS